MIFFVYQSINCLLSSGRRALNWLRDVAFPHSHMLLFTPHCLATVVMVEALGQASVSSLQ